MLFFDKLDSWQARAGLSDTDLARIANCSHTTIGRAKRGELFLSAPKREAICEASGGALTGADFAAFESLVVKSRRQAA